MLWFDRNLLLFLIFKSNKDRKNLAEVVENRREKELATHASRFNMITVTTEKKLKKIMLIVQIRN